MATTAVQIANLALMRVGHGQAIAALTESSPAAITINAIFEFDRDLVLREFAWPFAATYAALGLVEESPNDDWDYAYQYPADCLVALKVVNTVGRTEIQPIPFEVANATTGRLIYTDQDEATLKYTKRVTDAAQFDPLFASALAWKLASDVAMSLSRKPEIATLAERAYRLEVRRGQAAAINENAQDPEEDGEFVRCRH